MSAPALAQLLVSASMSRRQKLSGSVVRRKLEKLPRLIGGMPGIQSMTVVSR